MPAVHLLALLAAAGAEEIAVLGKTKELFFDDAIVASLDGVTRRVQPAQKHARNPVVRRTEPWEDPLNIVYGSVILDGDLYRMWYLSGTGVSYAESADGIEWVKPRLDAVTIAGERTNVLFRKREERLGSAELPYYQELFGVLLDKRDPDPQRRYKMGFLSLDWRYTGPRQVPHHRGQRRGLGVAASPDGIRWKLVADFATDAINDGATHWMLDPALDRHVLFGRVLRTPPEVEAAWSGFDWYKAWHSGRAVGRIESSDFVGWSHTEPGSAPVVMTADLQDPPGTEIYSLNVFPYEGQYIGLVQVFAARPDTCVLQVELAYSRDGVRFTRAADRSPFLAVGPAGSWDRFNQSLANNPPIAVGDELRFYYGGRTYRHSPYQGTDTGPRAGAIGVASIRRDRFVALEASFAGGTVVTRPLELDGATLHVNVRSDFGAFEVEARSVDGEMLARSRTIRSDSLDHAVEWQTGGLEGRRGPVVLRMTLQNASLYALWCR